MGNTILAKAGVNEITSGMQVKTIDNSAGDVNWNGEADTADGHTPFKILADGDYLINVVLWGDYLEAKKAGTISTLETDYVQTLPFHKGITPLLVYKVYEVDGTGVDVSGSSVFAVV